METLRQLAERLCREGTLLQGILSGPRNKSPEGPSKVKVKPVLLKEGTVFQFERTVGPKVFHENVAADEAALKLTDWLEGHFKQGLLQTAECDYQVLVNRKGQASILNRAATRQAAEWTHNRRKHYLLEEGKPVPFLVELGVMNAQGKVLAPKYDKFRQINRYLEIVEDVADELPKGRKLRIIDFGCGKSYLTFALYHYLVLMRGMDVDITGLDLKEDVIRHCAALADKLGYTGLQFQTGDISRYEETDQADMVVTLHACDTATDAALEKAVRWNTAVILSVPCCQHELNRQVQSGLLSPMLSHGIIKERFAALATDSIRARILELAGYRTQLLEFIDMEHTPKNILIRAVRHSAAAPSADSRQKLAREYTEFKQFLHADPYLERALQDVLEPVLKPDE